MKMKNLSEFVSLKIPVLNYAVADIPLCTHDLMIYGYLLFGARKNKGAAQEKIRKSLSADSVTIKNHLGILEGHGLVTRRGRQWFAREPQGDSQQWFKFLKNRCHKKSSGYWDDLVYTKVHLPSKKARSGGITAVTNLIYWKIVQWSVELADTGGHGAINIGNGRKPDRLSNRYLAKAVRADLKTVRRSIATLIRLKLIHTVTLSDGCFAVSVMPLSNARRDELWRKTWMVQPQIRGASLEELLQVPTKAVAQPTEEFSYEKILMFYNVPKSVSDKILALTHSLNLEFYEWYGKFEKCRDDNAANLAAKKTDVPHPGRLFLHELQKLEKAKNVCPLIDSIRDQPDGQELGAHSALGRIRGVSKEMKDLLDEVIIKKSLAAANGTRIPVKLTWNDLRDLASRPQITFEGFKKAVCDFLFSDARPGICPWLDEWLALTPLPQLTTGHLFMFGHSAWITTNAVQWASQLSSDRNTIYRFAQVLIDAVNLHYQTFKHLIKHTDKQQLEDLFVNYWIRLCVSQPEDMPHNESFFALLSVELEPEHDYDNINMPMLHS